MLAGAHRGKVKKISTESEAVSHQKGLVEILRQQGLTGLEELNEAVTPAADNNDDPLCSTMAAAALRYCSNLTKLELMEDWQSFQNMCFADGAPLRGEVGGC